MTKVKICGVNSEAAFDAVIEAGADYLGFVFFEHSPRFVNGPKAAALNARYAGGPLRVGLFVDPDPAAIRAMLDSTRLDILQIYGSVELCRQIRAATGLPVWRAIGVAGGGDLPADNQNLDGFVIEAKAPATATRPGGNALAMEWGLLTGWQAPSPWLLGGGLNAANVTLAIAKTGAPGVDVSSGVETAPGKKSSAMIREFVATVRGVARRPAT